jgi:hypothetical protein
MLVHGGGMQDVVVLSNWYIFCIVFFYFGSEGSFSFQQGFSSLFDMKVSLNLYFVTPVSKLASLFHTYISSKEPRLDLWENSL